MRYSLTVRGTARLSATTSPSGQQYPPSSRTEISKRPQGYSVRKRLQPLYVIKHSPTYSRNIRLLDRITRLSRLRLLFNQYNLLNRSWLISSALFQLVLQQVRMVYGHNTYWN